MLEVLRSHKRVMAIAAGSFIATNGVGYMFMVYTLSYWTSKLHVSRGLMLTAVVAGAMLWFGLVPAYGTWSDRVDRRPSSFPASNCDLISFLSPPSRYALHGATHYFCRPFRPG